MNGPVAWFIDNPIAANLLMVLLIFGGIFGLSSLDKEFFPPGSPDMVRVNMSYPGAGPSEVEEQICIRIEEAIHDLPGIKEIRSTASQGFGELLIEAETGYEIQRLTAEVKTRVDAINTFPQQAERPVINEVRAHSHMGVVTVAGDIGERNLKELGEQLRDELASQPHVSLVDLRSPRPYEVSVEVSEFTLRRYGLTFNDVVNAIRGSSLNLPAGAIKTNEGDIQLQTMGQAYSQLDFESIPLLTTREGTQVLLGDVARIVDGFEDLDVRTRFNDKPSHNMHVFVTDAPDTLATSEVLHKWADQRRGSLPPGVELTIWQDASEPFLGRVSLLVKNGVGGLLLVFILLMLFLRPLLALWVCVGIAVAFMGTFFMLPYTGASLNMLSLFALLLILGIVVDDAIIVGESVHARQMAGEPGAKGALNGTRGVLKPVIFAVVSTMIFFVPLLLLPGDMSEAAAQIPKVALLALAFSLVECLLILPSHLAHMGPPKPSRFAALRVLEQRRQACADALTRFAQERYRPFLKRCLDNNLQIGALFLCALLVSLALYQGGWVRSAFFPEVTGDTVEARVELSEGGAYQDTLDILSQVESAALALKAEYDADPKLAAKQPVIGHMHSSGRANIVSVLMAVDSGEIDTAALSRRWKELIGDLGEVKDFSIVYTFNDRGKPIELILSHSDVETLRSVTAELRSVLAGYEGVYNIRDSLQAPREEIVLDLRPAAENLSVSLADLATQVREAFYGAEAQRIPRTREDVRVMVRYPEGERLAVENLNEMRVRTPEGQEVPFDTVAEIRYQPGYQTIDRLDRKRTAAITAELANADISPEQIARELVRQHLPEWQQRYPGLELIVDGGLKEQQEFLGAMLTYLLLGMLIIYGLMAVAFRSYFQPILVLTAVPFGIMGGIFGHLILNWQISMFSLMGVIACAGVVVNDNLVLIDRINRLRGQGLSAMAAVLQGGQDRFRPIVLTSLTTFVGLIPIMMETSLNAQFLIPMVISLAFGVLFATGITLLLVPCLYLLGEQLSSDVLHQPQPLADTIERDAQPGSSM
ncbi:MAG: efflux RND transporter permease subunit [Pseudomonadota bacterium]